MLRLVDRHRRRCLPLLFADHAPDQLVDPLLVIDTQPSAIST